MGDACWSAPDRETLAAAIRDCTEAIVVYQEVDLSAGARDRTPPEYILADALLACMTPC